MLLGEQRDSTLSYREVGATANELPDGYRHLRHSLTFANGATGFAAGKAAIESWAGHRRAGIRLYPERPVVSDGQTVVLASRVAGLWVTAACRIVWVVDEPSRYGFAYGTLPHHPEIGEESFIVQRTPESQVTVEITAFSRPSSLLARLGGPITHGIQTRTTRLYLKGISGT